MGSYVKKKIEFLVVDTSAFINKAAIQDMGESILTVPQVVEEIKSKRQLRRLVVLPYDLSVKEAFPENVKFVAEFAKKTGDYPSLSVTDINVIALTYQLEKEKNGVDHLNSQPLCRPTVQPAGAVPEDMKKIAGFYIPKKEPRSRTQSVQSEAVLHCDSDTEDSYYSADDGEINNEIDKSELVSDEIYENAVELSTIKENEACNVEENVNEEEYGHGIDEVEVEEDNDNDYGEDYEDGGDDDGDDDDDDSHWITPSNIQEAKNQISSELNEDLENVNVACLTTDFAMQNVLKQIGLHVVSLDGKLIKQLRTFILRCYGCFKTTSIMSKVFCPNCGNKTLKKVAVSLDENGTPRLHINFRKPLTARGKRYSMPHFKGGKHSNNPVTCEDQPMPQQRPSRLSRTKNNPLNDDYIAGYSPFVTRDVTSKSAMLGIRPHIEMKHWMKKNPNESRKKKK